MADLDHNHSDEYDDLTVYDDSDVPTTRTCIGIDAVMKNGRTRIYECRKPGTQRIYVGVKVAYITLTPEVVRYLLSRHWAMCPRHADEYTGLREKQAQLKHQREVLANADSNQASSDQAQKADEASSTHTGVDGPSEDRP